MELRWDWIRNGVYGAYDPAGHCVARAENFIGPAGTSIGWMVTLTADEGVLFDPYPSLDDAQAAAAAALADL